jgi:hypothetical protein
MLEIIKTGVIQQVVMSSRVISPGIINVHMGKRIQKDIVLFITKSRSFCLLKGMEQPDLELINTVKSSERKSRRLAALCIVFKGHPNLGKTSTGEKAVKPTTGVASWKTEGYTPEIRGKP